MQALLLPTLAEVMNRAMMISFCFTDVQNHIYHRGVVYGFEEEVVHSGIDLDIPIFSQDNDS